MSHFDYAIKIQYEKPQQICILAFEANSNFRKNMSSEGDTEAGTSSEAVEAVAHDDPQQEHEQEASVYR